MSEGVTMRPDTLLMWFKCCDMSCRNAQHVNSINHIVTIRGQSGFYDTFKGWALGMLQVGSYNLGATHFVWGDCLLHVDTLAHNKSGIAYQDMLAHDTQHVLQML